MFATINTDTLVHRISIDPAVCHGKPCIKGHRTWVTLILDFLASGMSVEELLAGKPVGGFKMKGHKPPSGERNSGGKRSTG